MTFNLTELPTRTSYRLNYYGIKGNILHWIESFLRGCTQQVVVEGSKSSQCEVTYDIPQDTVLGPVLFLIFINDIVATCSIKSEIRLFADDILIYKTVITPAIQRTDFLVVMIQGCTE